VSAFTSAAFEPQSKEGALAEFDSHSQRKSPWIVIANGHWASADSPGAAIPPGLQVTSFARAQGELRSRLEPLLARSVSEERNPFRLLNAALAEDGVVVIVPRGTIVQEPLTIPFMTLSSPVLSHPRLVVFVEEGAQAIIAEIHSSSQGHPCSNGLTEIVLGPGAVLEHVRLVEGGPQAFHFGSVRVKQGGTARTRRMRSRSARRFRAPRST